MAPTALAKSRISGSWARQSVAVPQDADEHGRHKGIAGAGGIGGFDAIAALLQIHCPVFEMRDRAMLARA